MAGVYSPTLSHWLAWTSYSLLVGMPVRPRYITEADRGGGVRGKVGQVDCNDSLSSYNIENSSEVMGIIR